MPIGAYNKIRAQRLSVVELDRRIVTILAD
jgi:hypothetical protein